MERLSLLLAANVDAVNSLATIIGIAATLLGVVFSMAGALSFRRKLQPLPGEDAPLEQQVSLDDVRSALKRHQRIAFRALWTDRSLIFGQVVVGGILTSAFIQESLSKSMIGLLGLVVLVSSLIHQQVRPDLRYRGAIRRVMNLRRLERETENNVLDIKQNVAGAISVPFLRRDVSKRLSAIEESELEELPGEHTLQAKPNGVAEPPAA